MVPDQIDAHLHELTIIGRRCVHSSRKLLLQNLDLLSVRLELFRLKEFFDYKLNCLPKIK